MTAPMVAPVHVGEVRGRPLRLYPAPGARPGLPWVSAADWIAALASSREEEVEWLARLPRGHLKAAPRHRADRRRAAARP